MKLLDKNFGDCFVLPGKLHHNPDHSQFIVDYWEYKKIDIPRLLEKGLIDRNMMSARLRFVEKQLGLGNGKGSIVYISGIDYYLLQDKEMYLIHACEEMLKRYGIETWWFLYPRDQAAIRKVIEEWNNANPTKAPMSLNYSTKFVWVIQGNNYLTFKGSTPSLKDYGKGSSIPLINLFDGT